MPAAMSATEMPDLGRRVFGAGDRDQPDLALHQQVVRFLLRVRARRAVARDVADDQPRMPVAQRRRRRAQPIGRARREVLDEDVRALEQPREHAGRLRLLQVERQRLLRRFSQTK